LFKQHSLLFGSLHPLDGSLYTLFDTHLLGGYLQALPYPEKPPSPFLFSLTKRRPREESWSGASSMFGGMLGGPPSSPSKKRIYGDR